MKELQPLADPRFSLSLLGSASLRDGDGELVGFPSKAFALAAVLKTCPDSRCSRSALADLLYEGVGHSVAMANLRQLLARVQSRQTSLGMRLLVLSKEEVRLLDNDANVDIDLRTFDAVEVLTNEDDLKAFAERFGSDLLEGFEGSGEAFDSWLNAQRDQLRQRYLELVRSAAINLAGQESEDAFRHILQFDPYREDVWRELIKAAHQRDRAGAAERILQEMVARFSDDLGIAPSQETSRLVTLLQTERKSREAQTSYIRPAEALYRADPAEPAGAGTSAPRLCILMPHIDLRSQPESSLVGSLIEDVTLGLCRLRSLAMIAPHTAWRLAEEDDQTLDQLHLDYYVETNVRMLGDTARIYVKLIRVTDRVIISGDVYELSATHLGHYDRLTKLIVQALGDGLERAEAERFTTVARPDAYQHLLRGRQHMRVLDLPHVRRARKAFAHAGDCDPRFAPALSGIARTLIVEWLLLAQTDRNLLVQAQSIAQRAIELDPFSGEALRDLAGSTLLLGGLDEAKQKFAVAERLTPHHADILADHANALTHCSEMEAARDKITLAIDLNPLPPDDYLWTAGGASFFLNDYDDALLHLGRMKRQEPAYRLTAACLAMQGRKREAAYFVARALEDQPNFRIKDWVATIPLRSKAHVELYTQALSRAGFR